MMNHFLNIQKMEKIFFATSLSVILVIFSTGIHSSFAQEQNISNSTQTSEQPQITVQITKSATDSYSILNDETSIVGTFDTGYSIIGSSDSLNKSKDLIISTIIDDFDKSPTIGYIRAENITHVFDISNKTGKTMASLPNPFTDINTINSTITQQVSNAIDSAHKLNFSVVTIECDFEMHIKDWTCEEHGLNP
jgi:hypothetical protein